MRREEEDEGEGEDEGEDEERERFESEGGAYKELSKVEEARGEDETESVQT